MSEKKNIDLDILEHFKYMQDVANATRFQAWIPHATLPTEYNFVGRMIFNTTDEKLYIYTSKGWRCLPFADEIPLEYDDDGNIYFNEKG